MSVTPNPHFDELDWLDYVEGHSDPEERRRLSAHLESCPDCQRTTQQFQCFVKVLPLVGAALGEVPSSATGEVLDEGSEILDRATRSAAGQTRRFEKALARLDDLLQGDLPAELPAPDQLSEELIVAASHRVRALFRTDMERARELLSWIFAAFGALDPRPGGPLSRYGIAGALEASRSYVMLRDGDAASALDRLRLAERLVLADCEDPESELGYLERVRASCLHHLTRFDEALYAVSRAEAHHFETGDRDRWRRARHLRAIILSDSGRPDLAIPVYEVLMADPSLLADPQLHALIQLSQAADLVKTGQASRARPAFARAAELLRSSGQEDQLFRVRVGLADIAESEGRYEEALRLYVDLRPTFRQRGLAWGEIQQELSIAGLYLKVGRDEEAVTVCQELLPRARALGLNLECQKALQNLVEARQHLSQQHIAAAKEGILLAFRHVDSGSSAA